MQLPINEAQHVASLLTDSPLGIPASQAQPLLQSDAYKELVNKLAWSIGSVYRVPYGNTRTEARRLAAHIARIIVTEHGYPASIGYPK